MKMLIQDLVLKQVDEIIREFAFIHFNGDYSEHIIAAVEIHFSIRIDCVETRNLTIL